MLAERIRHARLAAGLTLDEAVDRLASLNVSITKAGLSKYELAKSTPSAAFLLKLGRALGVPSSYFLREPEVEIQWIAFRKRSSLSVTRQEQIKAFVADRAENQYWLQTTLNVNWLPTVQVRVAALTPQDAEDAARLLREAWSLDDLPIESITEVVEDRGGIVVGYEDAHFDGLSGWINGTIPLAAVNTAVPDDRRRYNLAHELGHMVMVCDSLDDKAQENLAHRFAAAFIVPPQVARRELGVKRRQLDLAELGLLKQKHGLSMQAWARRALDLDIIDDGHYRTLCMEFARRGWRKREPVPYRGKEAPAKLRQLTLRALAEGIISLEKAAQLCPDGFASQEPILTSAPARRLSARELRSMPAEVRDQLMALAAAEAEGDYQANAELTDFEAFGEEDLYDSTDAR